MTYYTLTNILKNDADYNIVIGERSNGKTYAALAHAVTVFVKSGYKSQLALLRRYKEDFRGKRAATMFDGLVSTGFISEITQGEFDTVVYTSGRFYLAYFNEKLQRNVMQATPLGFAFALSDMEHDKSSSYPNVQIVVFDEFMSRRGYLEDEFTLFMNCLSTIIRNRDNVQIFMLGNTVDQHCIYFKEMGLKHIKHMKQGSIDTYKFGELKISVEYTKTNASSKASNKYFAFDNSDAVQMIVKGAWQMDIYPHLTAKYKPQDIVFTYFIDFENVLLQCEIVSTDSELFTYVHEKTTPLRHPNTDIVFSLERSEKKNYLKRLFSAMTPLQEKIARFYAADKVFYQNNEIGEMVRKYIQLSTQTSYSK